MAVTKVKGYMLNIKWGDKLIRGLQTSGIKMKPNYEEILLKSSDGDPDDDIIDYDSEFTASGQTYERDSGESGTYEDYETLREAAAAGAVVAFVYGRFSIVDEKIVSGNAQITDYSEEGNSKDTGNFSITFKAVRGSISFTTLPGFPARNVDEVLWNSIESLPTSGGVPYPATVDADPKKGNMNITLYKYQRMTGNGTLSSIMLYNITTTNVLNLMFYVWRFDGSTFNRVYYEDILSKLTAGPGIKTVSLATPVNIQEGDFTGLFAKANPQASVNYYINKVGFNALAVDDAPITTDYDTTPVNWLSHTLSPYTIIVHGLGQAPLIVGIGDSMIESYPSHTSMVDGARTAVDVDFSWMYKLHALDNRFIYQDCGFGGETSTMVLARFNRDVVLKKPRFVVINGGVNDIAEGVISKATFLSNWEDMLDACLANDIIPIVWKIMPCNNLDNTEMQTRDEWNADLVTLFNTYNIAGKIIIDWDADLGVNRVGGDPGNLWDINPTYKHADNTHLLEAGQAKIAEVMLREIGEEFTL